MFDLSQIKMPYRVTWHMTDRCNLKCPHCYVPVLNPSHKTVEITASEAKAMIADLISSDIYMISFAGGEPLLREDFLEIATYARKSGMTIQVSTNGLFVKKVGIQKIKDAGFKCIQISLDGVEKHLHEVIRGSNTFEETLDAIRSCIKLNLPVIIAVAISKLNPEKIQNIYEVAKKEGVWGVKLQMVTIPFSTEPGSDNQALSQSEILSYLEEAKVLFALSDINLSIAPSYIMMSNNKITDDASCNSLMDFAVILPNGAVGLCDYDRSMAVGDIISNGFKDSWAAAIEHKRIKGGCRHY